MPKPANGWGQGVAAGGGAADELDPDVSAAGGVGNAKPPANGWIEVRPTTYNLLLLLPPPPLLALPSSFFGLARGQHKCFLARPRRAAVLRGAPATLCCDS